MKFHDLETLTVNVIWFLYKTDLGFTYQCVFFFFFIFRMNRLKKNEKDGTDLYIQSFSVAIMYLGLQPSYELVLISCFIAFYIFCKIIYNRIFVQKLISPCVSFYMYMDLVSNIYLNCIL